MRYSLRQIQVFLATARYENITRAADALAMSQSAASSSLADLEQKFGVQLFDRRGKRLQLSALGRQLRPQAELLMDQAQALEMAISSDMVAGQLRVGATLTIGNYLAVAMLADYRQRYPAVEASLSVANTAHIANQVASYDLDLGLVEGEFHHPELEISPWRSDELVVFCAPQHPLARQQQLSDPDLQSVPWILRESGSGTRQTFDRALAGLLPDVDVSLELQHTEAIKRAVAAGMGVGCLSRIALQEAFARGSLVPLEVPQRDFSRQLTIIRRRDKFHSQAMHQWLSLCQESADV